jgi:signal transduction histidine kinase
MIVGGIFITSLLINQRRLRKSRDELRNLAAHLQSIREEERTRIAREVHDELGQILTIIKMDVTLLQKKYLSDGQTSAKLEAEKSIRGIFDLLDNSIRSVRRIATELRPEVLDDLGLKSALEWESEMFQKRTGISCECKVTAEELLPEDEKAIAVFRIYQEALTNVARHSNATKVISECLCRNGTLSLRLEDNGQGITEQETQGEKSLGLVGMRERALLIGGTLEIRGVPGKGTSVVLTVPIGTQQ